MDSKSFWETVEQNRKTVAMWPEWMQNIIITAEAANTGRFIRSKDEKDSTEKRNKA